jgi:dinuclear metal center YbgI/SA1388 family protein
MTSVKNVFDYIDSIAPFDSQLQWDNSGILVGEPNRLISRIGVVLDITPQTVELAAARGVELIVSHHPVIFRPQKSFTDESIAYRLAAHGISAICAHTSLDSAAGGVNDVLARALGLKRVEPLVTSESETPLLRAGFVPKMRAVELASVTAQALGGECYALRYCDSGRMIETVAVCGGAGKDFIDDVINAGIDAYITGDAGHHDFLYAAEKGLTLIAAGHFETENPVVEELAGRLSEQFESVETIVLNQSVPAKYFVISD